MSFFPFELPKIKYDYDALEPVVSKTTMKIHHQKHHKLYIDKLNEIIEKDDFLKELPIDQLISKKNLDKIDEKTATKIKNFGGGHYNHIMFFDLLSPKTSKPGKLLKSLIDRDFGNFKSFEDNFKQNSQDHFGSGWCWLMLNKDGLKIKCTTNQNNPLNDEACVPVMGIDLWEHSYYLDYQNRKKDYIEKIWTKINWKDLDNKILEAEYVK